MGKKVDIFVLTAGITVGFYLYFRSTIENTILCVILALTAGILARKTVKRISGRIQNTRRMRRRKLRRCAGSALMELACMVKSDAEDRLSSLIQKTYGETYSLEVIQRHPSSTLIQDDIFELWRARRGSEKLVICATCAADFNCRAMATELKNPRIALVDADGLSTMMSEHPEDMFPPTQKPVRRRLRLQHLAGLFFNRKNAPRCLTMFLSMLAIYIFSFNPFYLAAALLLLFVALASLRRKSKPAKLF